MNDAHWERAVELFNDLVERDAVARARFWDDHPDVPSDVCAEVLGLFDAHEAASGCLECPAVGNQPPPPGTVIGPWRLAEQIGQGGMSIVYRGERIEGGYSQRAAIKLIALPTLTTGRIAEVIHRRFEAERQIVARLEHPDICTLLDGGMTPAGVPYLALEYVDGVDVLTYAAGLDPTGRLEVLARIARAVHYAHQRLVVHRDLKPSNVLITVDGSPKLLDFGIAKALDPELWNLSPNETVTTMRAATPAYASPEQLRGDTLTTATDIYSLGRLVERVFADRPSADVDAIVAKATRDEPGERYASAADLAADLDRCRDGRPVEARLGSVRYRIGKFVRRYRAPVAAAAAFVALIIGFAAVTRVQMYQVRQERERATQVADFLRSLFQASDPEINQGNRLTTRQLLDAGADRMRRTTPTPVRR